MPLLEELNARAISTKEVRKAVNEIKSGMAPGADCFPVKLFKIGVMTVLNG